MDFEREDAVGSKRRDTFGRFVLKFHVCCLQSPQVRLDPGVRLWHPGVPGCPRPTPTVCSFIISRRCRGRYCRGGAGLHCRGASLGRGGLACRGSEARSSEVYDAGASPKAHLGLASVLPRGACCFRSFVRRYVGRSRYNVSHRGKGTIYRR